MTACDTLPLWANNPQIAPGSSAEVIGAKTKKDIKKEELEKAAPPQAEVTVEKPAEKPKETASFFVRRILLEGNELIPSEKIKPFLAPYEGRQLHFEDLQALCKKLEEVFRGRGFLAAVYVPPQRIENEEAKLQVVVSRMGDLTVEGARYFKESNTRAFWKTPKNDVLQFHQIEHDLMSMNENPDRKVQAVLRAGKTPESSDIYLKQEDHLPLHLGLSMDDQGAKLTGKERGGVTLRDNNLLGLDDQLFATAVFGEDYGTIFVRHELPISTNGARLVTHFSHSQVNPKKEFESFGINSISQTYGVEIRQWFLRTLTSLLEGYIGFNAEEKRTRVLSQTSTRDRLRVLTLGGDFQSFDPAGSWTVQQNVDIGLDFGIEDTALTSRQSKPSFFKYGFLVQRSQQLFSDTKGIITFQGQLSPDKLTPEEQFFFGGANSVRGYPESDYGADEGVLGNFEYWIPAFFIPRDWKIPGLPEALGQQTQIIPFVDYGYGWLNEPSLTEQSSREFLGAGIGIRVQFQKNAWVRFDWGFPLADRPLTEAGRSQFYWRVQWDF